MKIGGLGDFESIRKASQKDESRNTASARMQSSASSESRSDAVQISPKAKMLGMLTQIPELREDKIAEIRAKLEDGTLMTEESVREGITNMLESML